MDGLEACVRGLDPASRALLDLSLRRGMRDDHMAPLLRIDPFNLAWRRARAIERVASRLGLDDPSGLAQVRAALPHLPEQAWCVPLELEAGEPPAAEDPADPDLADEAGANYDGIDDAIHPTPDGAATVEGSAETIEFDVVTVEPDPEETPEHSWGPRALAVRPAAARPMPAPPPALPPTLRTAISLARDAIAARPATARGALLAGAGAVLGALLSRRRR
ncbi:MAG: hypothetical protein E6G53_10950 [Actinobacteria bacterium]|nr:MAG: hypothetical protein E6G53_10950 [Actinomycetota bacterium]